MRFTLFFIIVFFFAIGSVAALLVHTPARSLQYLVSGDTRGSIGGAFSMKDTHGAAVTDKTFRGKLLLVYFGYTRSPDISPAGLQVLSGLVRELEKSHPGKIQALFVTLDPDRDTAPALDRFLSNYDSRIRGLRGVGSQLETMARSYRVYYEKFSVADEKNDYLLRHSSYIYLMDRSGGYLKHFNHGAHPDKMLKAILKHL